MNTLLTFLLALALNAPFEIDKTVHDFGKVSQKDGPVSCTFTITNTGGGTPLDIRRGVQLRLHRRDLAP